MTSDQYKQARVELCHTVKQWCNELGISESAHDSYSCGRRDVPPVVSNHIRRWLKHVREIGCTG